MKDKEQIEKARKLIMATARVQAEPIPLLALLDSVVTSIPDHILRMAAWDLISDNQLRINQDLRVSVVSGT